MSAANAGVPQNAAAAMPATKSFFISMPRTESVKAILDAENYNFAPKNRP
jgi:hypothetical protein